MTLTTPNGMIILTIIQGTLTRDGLGLVLKRKSDRLPSEGYYQGIVLGDYFIRTFSWTRRAKAMLA